VRRNGKDISGHGSARIKHGSEKKEFDETEANKDNEVGIFCAPRQIQIMQNGSRLPSKVFIRV
jgi:hypothetical protein